MRSDTVEYMMADYGKTIPVAEDHESNRIFGHACVSRHSTRSIVPRMDMTRWAVRSTGCSICHDGQGYAQTKWISVPGLSEILWPKTPSSWSQRYGGDGGT